MPHWLIKSLVQRTLSVLPASHLWNAFFQEHVTRSLELTPERFETRLEFSRRHLDHFLELHPHRSTGFRALEIGTGWYPIVPVGLFLCGATQVHTLDIAALVQKARLKQMLLRFVDYERTGQLQRVLPRVLPERAEQLRKVTLDAEQFDPEALLKELNIHAQVRDAQSTGLPPATIDLFVSTGVLEYIPRAVLNGILSECRRLGTADAVQSHYLNLVDQYSYFDRSITPFNFLKFSSRQWKYLNSPLTWQNRLRISDYRELFAEAGYEITKEVNTPGSAADLDSLVLDPEFRKYSREDLLVLLSWIVARPRAG